MLDKRCKIILNTLKKNGYIFPKKDFENIEKSLIPILPNHKKYKWSWESIVPQLQYLRKLGYIDFVEITHGAYPVLDCHMLYLTYTGRHYKLFTFLRLKNLFYTSFLIPALVAIIAALLTE